MDSRNDIADVGSLEEKTAVDTSSVSSAWVGDQHSVLNGGCTTSESVRPIDVSEQGIRKFTVRSYDCDSHAKATTVSQIDKGLSVGTMGQPTFVDTEVQQSQPLKQSGPLDSVHQEYYVHQKLSKNERRMSSLSMGSARASTGRRERYLSLDEQYEMLKLHHLNLLNEIHETAIMLNLFEQRQLIREQQFKTDHFQRVHLVDNSESTGYHQNQEKQQLKASYNTSDVEEQVVKFGNTENIKSVSNKRCMGENLMPNKRQK